MFVYKGNGEFREVDTDRNSDAYRKKGNHEWELGSIILVALGALAIVCKLFSCYRNKDKTDGDKNKLPPLPKKNPPKTTAEEDKPLKEAKINITTPPPEYDVAVAAADAVRRNSQLGWSLPDAGGGGVKPSAPPPPLPYSLNPFLMAAAGTPTGSMASSSVTNASTRPLPYSPAPDYSATPTNGINPFL